MVWRKGVRISHGHHICCNSSSVILLELLKKKTITGFCYAYGLAGAYKPYIFVLFVLDTVSKIRIINEKKDQWNIIFLFFHLFVDLFHIINITSSYSIPNLWVGSRNRRQYWRRRTYKAFNIPWSQFLRKLPRLRQSELSDLIEILIYQGRRRNF